MKPFFEVPIVEIIELNDKDIVCTSGCQIPEEAAEYELDEEAI